MMQDFFFKDKVFSVTELNSLLKDILEGNFPQIVIEGEISNYRPNSSGHLYFTLKDENSQISAVMFRGNALSLTFIPKDGTKVQCTGKLSVYTPRGSYQIVITKMNDTGAGNILKMLEDRKRRLAMEGLFDEKRKRKLPEYPKTIGIITSPTGAALRDILQITKRRNKCINVIILPSLVQGEGACFAIEKQIKAANNFKICDILIVGRGGGSLEDLLPFSEENVVRAVAESEIPIISAVGHEIDWALTDYAADKRAPTPSAAAEIAVPLLSETEQLIEQYINDLQKTMESRIEKAKLTVKNFQPENMELKFRAIEQPLMQRFDYARQELEDCIKEKIKNAKQSIENYITVLETTSPKAIFARGYSMVTTENGDIIRNSGQIEIGAKITIIPSQGKITAKVEEKE